MLNFITLYLPGRERAREKKERKMPLIVDTSVTALASRWDQLSNVDRPLHNPNDVCSPHKKQNKSTKPTGQCRAPTMSRVHAATSA